LRTATASAASAPARLAASTRLCASVLSADWLNRSDVAGFEESGDAADGEEITNKILAIEEELKDVWSRREFKSAIHQMCLIHLDFKHFLRRKAKEFR
jgi:hypothetical protein